MSGRWYNNKMTVCPRCGITYVATNPALVEKHQTCTPKSAAREGREFWAIVERDLSNRAGGR